MSYSIKTILVPYDFSDIADEGLNTAAKIAKKNNARLIVLHVVEYTEYVAAQSAVMGQVILADQELRDIAEQKLASLKEKLAEECSIETMVLEGPVVISTIDTAIRNHVDLIVAGTHGASGFREFFIGSNAYKFVKQSPCPVLTVPKDGSTRAFKKIFFPVRVNTGGAHKYEFAKEIMSGNDSALNIVVYSKSDDEQKRLQEEEMQHLKDQLEKDGVNHTINWKITENISQDVLVQSIEQHSDLIVVTSTLDYVMKDFFVGPFAQQIVNHARVPVLNIKPSLTLNN